jgi:hypothetical protein
MVTILRRRDFPKRRELLLTDEILLIPHSASFSMIVSCICCNTGCFDIAPLEECHSSIQGSRTNLASVDKRLDMRRTDWMMAVLANHSNCLDDCDPIAAHQNASSPGKLFTCKAKEKLSPTDSSITTTTQYIFRCCI